jgi:hypothetical protein
MIRSTQARAPDQGCYRVDVLTAGCCMGGDGHAQHEVAGAGCLFNRAHGRLYTMSSSPSPTRLTRKISPNISSLACTILRTLHHNRAVYSQLKVSRSSSRSRDWPALPWNLRGTSLPSLLAGSASLEQIFPPLHCTTLSLPRLRTHSLF